MNVVITGTTGFVGGHLAAQLLRQGFSVVGAARGVHTRALLKAGLVPAPHLARALDGQIDVDAISPDERALVRQAELVFHLSGDASFGDGPQYLTANVEPTRRLVDLLRTEAPALRRLVFASTLGAQDRDPREPLTGPLDELSSACPTTDYGRSKLLAEEIVTSSDLPVAVARLGMVVGSQMRPGSHLAVVAATAARVPPVVLEQLGGVLPIVHVDDACAALALLATHPEPTSSPYLVVADNVTVAQAVAALDGRDGGSGRGSLLTRAVTPLRTALPFRLRSMLLPELAVSAARLRSLGWEPHVAWDDAVREVGSVVAARRDHLRSPSGHTIVTGAGSGLGRAVAVRLAGLGRRLVLVDLDAESLDRLRSDIPDAVSLVVDMRELDAMATILDRIHDEGSHVSELFACAGMGRKGRVGAVGAADEVRSLDVNLRGRIASVVEVLPEMTARNFGRIVLVSSSSAFQALPEFATYGASNAGLLNFGQALAAEVGSRGIRVLTVCPGGMDTNFQARAGVRRPEGERLLGPATVVDAMLDGLSSGAAVVVVGSRAKAMDLAGRILPRSVQSRLWARMVASRR